MDVSNQSVMYWIGRAQLAQARALGYRDAETRYYPEPIGDESDISCNEDEGGNEQDYGAARERATG